MFPQQSQDGRQNMQGMHIQQQHVQQQHVQQNMTPQQMQQRQLQMNQNQQNMAAMQQNVPGMPISSGVQPGTGTMTRMGTIGPQHSMGGPGVTHQPDMTGGARPVSIGMQQNVVVKSEGVPMQVGTNPMAAQRMQVPISQAQPQQAKHEAHTSSQQQQQPVLDRIVNFKQLLPQLRECLVNLIAIARLRFAGNAALDNLEKNINPSSIPRFDKVLEQFYSICNSIEMHLTIAHDQMSHTLYSMQYTPITANQMREGPNPNVLNSYIDTVHQQLAFAKEIQNILIESSNKILTRQSMLQPPQQSNQSFPQRHQF